MLNPAPALLRIFFDFRPEAISKNDKNISKNKKERYYSISQWLQVVSVLGNIIYKCILLRGFLFVGKEAFF